MRKRLFSMLLMGAFILAPMSLFTSCSEDYDDDIKANKVEITSLRTELQSVKQTFESQLLSEKSSFETQIAAVKAELQSAIDKKADSETVTALKTQLQNLETDYAARMAVLTTQIETATDAIAKIDQKADKATVDGVLADLAALTGKLSDETLAREAVEANLKIQTEALEKLRKEITDANYQGQIDALIEAIKKFETTENAEKMRADMQNLQKMISDVNANVDALTVLIERALSSIALVPSLYIDGIEAIEFKSLAYTPVKPGSSGLTPANTEIIRIHNGTTEATYRLNPTTVQRDGINEDAIDFVAARAETRGADILSTSPVSFNGIKEFSNGLMTVYLKKNITGSLNDAGNGKIYIVSLKVPRNAEKYEAADIYSENSRLYETTITPRIASLPWNTNGWTDGNGLDRPHHYSDSAGVSGVYSSNVDATPLALVAQKIYYKDSFNLNTIVTGCYDRATNTHNQITKSELKAYGLTFRYAIAKSPYTRDVDNQTDQQVFASVTPQGIITSKTPAGLTDNAAVVGKEPIVRVMLVDSVRNKLVDERYMKIKWIEKEEEVKKPIQLADKKSEATLGCNNVNAEFTWLEFVNEIYAKAQNMEGLSQNRFKEIYGDNPTITAMGWTTNWSPSSDTSAPATGTISPATGLPYTIPVWQATSNENGDALVGTWTLTPEDIYTVYCNSQNDTKTFTAKVYFKSTRPTEYPDLWFNWTYTIKLPTLPSIVGFYEQYWRDNLVGQEHDVVPVQYGSPAQTLSYCVYNSNLMNAFTFETVSGVRRFIVKGMPECGTWDLQFSYAQSISPYKPNYNAPGTNAWKSKGLWTNTLRDAYTTFPAYKLMKSSTIAANMIWNVDHTSWCGNPAHKEANLFLDHNNPANWDLLNPLAQTDVTGPDGTVQPDRTHEKPVNMTVWATLNNYNYIPVHEYKIHLIAPLRINMNKNLGNVQDGVSSGDALDLSKGFELTDFRGYLVKDAPGGTTEQTRYTQQLWKYYEVDNNIHYQWNNVRYTFKKVNKGGVTTVEPDTSLPWALSMNRDDLVKITNGGIDPSWNPVLPMVYFFQNGGSYIEAPVKAYVPVSVDYGFGSLTGIVEIMIYPHGQKPN